MHFVLVARNAYCALGKMILSTEGVTHILDISSQRKTLTQKMKLSNFGIFIICKQEGVLFMAFLPKGQRNTTSVVLYQEYVEVNPEK